MDVYFHLNVALGCSSYQAWMTGWMQPSGEDKCSELPSSSVINGRSAVYRRLHRCNWLSAFTQRQTCLPSITDKQLIEIMI